MKKMTGTKFAIVRIVLSFYISIRGRLSVRTSIRHRLFEHSNFKLLDLVRAFVGLLPVGCLASGSQLVALISNAVATAELQLLSRTLVLLHLASTTIIEFA